MTSQIIVDQNTNNQFLDLTDIKIIGVSSFTAVASALLGDFDTAKTSGIRAITLYRLIPPAAPTLQ